MLIWIVFIGIAIISYLVQANLKSKFEKYSQMPLTNGMTGKEVAWRRCCVTMVFTT
mgnify:CR=1 FL=1